MADDINPVHGSVGQSFVLDNEHVGDSAGALALPMWADFGQDPTQPGLHVGGDEGIMTALSPPGPSSSEHQVFQTHRLSHPVTNPPNSASHTSTRVGGKVDGRFPSTATKVLKSWFEHHSKHPYPTPEEVHQLHGQTGLTVQQIRDWFANSRRRAKRRFPTHGTISPQTRSSQDSLPRDIPRRAATPRPLEQMSPLQRWANSPPDEEPALLSDISQALSASPLSSGHGDPLATWLGNLDEVSSPRSHATSQSSAGSGSCSSSFSQTSHAFWPRAQARNAKKARRRQQTQKQQPSTNRISSAHDHTYQCTFCPKSFGSKYDWQRHEKSLHLPFEQWVCSPPGATQNLSGDDATCAFCGQREPDQPHLASHNHDSCLDKPLIERTFYRKDHLVQHLHSVHRVPYSERLMSSWKVISQDIRSRCGFCDAWLSSWTSRADHIARHFKDGRTMADWKGDWGFEPSVIEMLDNAMPPYLISYEQNTLLPFPRSGRTARARPSAYQLIKQEMGIEIQRHFESHGEFPSDDELRKAGLAIFQTADSIVDPTQNPAASWLRDIFLPSGGTRVSVHDGGSSQPHGIDTTASKGFFGECDMEFQLRRYARIHVCLGQEVADDILQAEACRILHHADDSSLYSSRYLVGFLKRLIWVSTTWLAPLRARAADDLVSITGTGMITDESPSARMGVVEPRPQRHDGFISQDMLGSTNPTNLDSHTPESQGQWASTLHDGLLCTTTDPVICPSATAINSGSSFLAETDPNVSNNSEDNAGKTRFLMPSDHFISSGYSAPGNAPCQRTVTSWSSNAYQKLARGLSLYAMKAMSLHNPQCHVPTDDELRYQARWLLYDDDDPWNQTPADNTRWLEEFKREIGLTTTNATTAIETLG